MKKGSRIRRILIISTLLILSTIALPQISASLLDFDESYIPDMTVSDYDSSDHCSKPSYKEKGVRRDDQGRIISITGVVVYLDLSHINEPDPYIYVGFDTTGDGKEDYRMKVYVSGPDDPILDDLQLSMDKGISIKIDFIYNRGRRIRDWELNPGLWLDFEDSYDFIDAEAYEYTGNDHLVPE